MQKFSMPKDMWLKFGCFLSGHNYSLLAECSETSKKYVRKLTSALLIITIIWSMIGYMFATRYTESGILGGFMGALFAGIIIIQIERQIILGSTERAKMIPTLIFRLLLGLIVAVIGALILDQVFFKNDIAREKENLINQRIGIRTIEIRKQSESTIAENQRTIGKLEEQIQKNLEDIKRSPTFTSNTQTSIDTSGGKKIISTKSPNPLLEENKIIRGQTDALRNAIMEERSHLGEKIEKEKERIRKEKPGFLDELNIIYNLATSSGLSAFAYFLFLFFFIFIELFIVIAKFMDGENDYYKVMKYQEKIREERLKILEQKRSAALGENERIDLSNELISNLPK
ncbi:MAG: DUF4407 domain-containing protein [Leadbetterella sp.]|nr:DUF4407 domain-containing protein [Leadbetterella sp.]